MRKIYLMFAMLCFACTVGFAQETETVYWVDSTNNAKVLNPSKFRDNWFIGLHAGSFYSWGSNTSGAGFFKQLRPAFGLSFGKMVHPAGGFRLQAALGQNRGETEDGQGYKWGAVAGYVDGMFNLTNIFCNYKEGRRFNLLAIIGLGVERTFSFADKSWFSIHDINNEASTSFALRAGLMGKFRLNNAWDFTVEAVNNWIDDSFDGQTTNNRYDGHVNIFLGLNYRFRNHDGTRDFTYATRDMAKYDDLNQELNRLRAEAAKPVEPNVIIQKKTIKSNQVSSLISFEDGKSTVNKLQQVNVYTAVQAWSQHENATIFITLNENAKDTDPELFQKRAESIKNMMVNEFQVKAEDIVIEADADNINTLNPDQTAVIVFINK